MLKTLLRFAGGITLGGAMGVAIGLALAPKSGTEFKDYLRNFVEEVKAAGQQAESVRRQELETRFAQAKRFRIDP